MISETVTWIRARGLWFVVTAALSACATDADEATTEQNVTPSKLVDAPAAVDAPVKDNGAVDLPPNDCAATVAVYSGQVSLRAVCVKVFITPGTTPVLVAGGMTGGDEAPFTVPLWVPCGVPVTFTGYSTGCLNPSGPTGSVTRTLQENTRATIDITLRRATN